jgi:hypothetical protein
VELGGDFNMKNNNNKAEAKPAPSRSSRVKNVTFFCKMNSRLPIFSIFKRNLLFRNSAAKIATEYQILWHGAAWWYTIALIKSVTSETNRNLIWSIDVL